MKHLMIIVFLLSAIEVLNAANTETAITFTGGSVADLQALLDKAPTGAVVVCAQTKPLEVSTSIWLRKPVTLRGLKANLLPKVGKTPILMADAEKITLTDIEMHGNYDSVSQTLRAPFIHVKRGGFVIERCKFYDGTKDGIMVTPEKGTGDIVGGTIRDIEGERMGRDLVSLSGGNEGLRIRDVTVENINLKKGYFRGAVEVSDGADNIIVRHVYAEEAVYGIDVQDHGGSRGTNTKVVLEDVTAVRCRHIIRTANNPLSKHTDLTLRNSTGKNCRDPVSISNTTGVRIENLSIIADQEIPTQSFITLRNVHHVLIRNATMKRPAKHIRAVTIIDCTDVKLEGVTCNGAPVDEPFVGGPRAKKGRNQEKTP